jgi:hypothetical protein
MGDTTNLTMTVKSRDPRVRAIALDKFREYSGGHNEFHESEDATSLEMGASDCSVGSADELDSNLRNAITDAELESQCGFCKGDGCENCDDSGIIIKPAGEFAWHVHEDPAYEYMGDVFVHVPEVGYFTAECDSDGNPRVTTDALITAVNEATDLDALKGSIESMTGDAIIKAFFAYDPPAV